jgi:cation:H+ antiporter
MQVVAQLVVFVGALVVLAIIAGVLVDAVIIIAHRLRIPGSIAGATLAAAATSAPELGTNIFALLAASKEPAAANIGIGAIVGSAVFNLTVIIGLIAITGRSVPIAKRVARRDGVIYAAAVLLLLVFLGAIGMPRFSLSSLESAALVTAYGLYLWWLVSDARASGGSSVGSEEDDHKPIGPAFVKLAMSAVVITVGCHFLVDSTRFLARHLVNALELEHHAATSLLSLVVVAAATSVPDALASLAAARRSEASLAVANAIGSNTFDILICIGLPITIIGRRTVAPVTVASGVYLLMATIVLLASLRRRPTLTRAKGLILLTMYAAFLGLVAMFVLHA